MCTVVGVLDPPFEAVLVALRERLQTSSIPWAIMGSTNLALQGLSIEPNDIDVQTTAEGATVIEEQFHDQVVEPVTFSEGDRIRSHYGKLELNGIPVEIMGDLQKRQTDGDWGSPIDVEAHRESVILRGDPLPVLSLRCERQVYDTLGRTKRVEQLREHLK